MEELDCLDKYEKINNSFRCNNLLNEDECDELIDICYIKKYIHIYIDTVSLKCTYYLRASNFDKAEKLLILLKSNFFEDNYNNQLNYYNLMGMFHWYYNQNFNKSIEYLEEGTKLINDKLIDNNKFIYYNYHTQGVVHCSLREYAKAYKFLTKADKIHLDKKDDNIKVSTYNWLGIIETKFQEYKNALVYFEKAAKILKKQLMFAPYADILNSIGLVYLDLFKYSFAKESFAESIDLAKKYKIDIILADAYNNYGLVFKEENDIQMAEEYFIKSLEVRNRCNNFLKKAYTLGNYALLKIKQKDYKTAEKLFFESLETLKNNEDKIFLSKTYVNLAELYIETKEYQKANKFLIKAKTIYKDYCNGSDDCKMEFIFFFKAYLNYYKEMKQYKKALEYFEYYHDARKRFTDIETTMKAELFHTKTEIEKIRYQYENRIEKERIKAALAMAVTANHEINQPLTVMQTAVDIINNPEFLHFPLDKQKKYTVKISESIEKINHILKRFRDQSNISFDDYMKDSTKMVKYNKETG